MAVHRLDRGDEGGAVGGAAAAHLAGGLGSETLARPTVAAGSERVDAFLGGHEEFGGAGTADGWFEVVGQVQRCVDLLRRDGCGAPG